MRKHTAVDLAQVSRKEGVFRRQLALAELAIDQRDVAILVELGTSQFELVARLDDSATKTGIVVEKA